ncbi:hypothetical protein ACH4T9_12815 [Micromonospora sp. NPDC020750]|uniref:hypothetical protein n=1 Tax=unclassified Micromonospora TaxID=2617518 RepID=UPI00379EB741
MPFVPAPQPCWVILVEGDWVGCGACHGRAVALAAVIAAEEAAAGAQVDGPPVIRRADGYCVLLTCSGCGEWWLDEAGMAVHSAGMVDALKGAVECGWVGDACPACQAAELMP